ncbi:Pleckstrin (PH) and lipid-binding START domains-containing protein isoform 3 [Hibiscus syriacus]|uniref:Pleckstrin (PH) and lipid-binding START domains-containing protein isoform 3 n=1 Tax=Hibiscus syriacus TaxID=106335 RepID=A0A6A2XKN1_HIBSY|nr:Pleckstrin (PH) and lipid-binding START domains-containing protein isoform 3 [Hibiscus syriacus]
MDEDYSCCQHWNDHPATMTVGMVDGTSEAIFLALMSLGPQDQNETSVSTKAAWSSALTIIRISFTRSCIVISYLVILYHSVVHDKCPPQSGYVRSHLKSGGYVITPVNQGQQSTVKHMLAIDWKLWKFYVRPSAARSLTISMLKRVAVLRELFKGKQGNYSSICLSREWLRHIQLPQTEK